ncbi:MAG: hypothetical protein NZM11_06225 [Anaerolineales bacterium]|nr:hypothetical protein [Anaerolineales bacterium]
MANDLADRDSTNELDEARPGSASLSGGRDVSVGGDVVGRDKVTQTSTSTTYISEGGPAARYAIIGIVIVALAAIGLFAFLAWRNAPPPSVTATPALTATHTPVTSTPDLTATALAAPATAAVLATATPTPTATATAAAATTLPATPTEALVTFTPTSGITPTATATAEPTATPTSTETTSPPSNLPLYDDFNDDCLDANRWTVQTNPGDFATPAPASASTDNGCLQTDDQFFVEENDGVLSVATSLEGEQSFGLAASPPICFSEAEVTLVLNEVNVFEGRRSAYLSVGVDIAQRTRQARVEVRLLGSNQSGPRRYHLFVRLITAAGPSDYGLRDYIPGRPVTVAFRVINEHLVISANGQPFIVLNEDGQPVPVAFTIRGNPCALTLGYRAEDQIALTGTFDDVRLQPVPGP